ncbi:MAG: hypothetical protein CMC82_05540 [Flavobacteriaceae bacterium]|nr:hypothetical protein [Flavobacteriaceae bacterium]
MVIHKPFCPCQHTRNASNTGIAMVLSSQPQTGIYCIVQTTSGVGSVRQSALVTLTSSSLHLNNNIKRQNKKITCFFHKVLVYANIAKC